MKLNNIVLWGTGIIGQRYYSILKKMDITPIMFIDNNINKQNMYIDGIQICSPLVLKNHSDYLVLIASKASDEIYNQAIGLGVLSSRIYKVQEAMGIVMLHAIHMDAWGLNNSYKKEINKNSIAFDLQNGVALGGVETWVLEQGIKLSKHGFNIACLLANDESNQLTIPVNFERINVCELGDFCAQIERNVESLLGYGYGIVISNFAGNNMLANCYYKRINKHVRHIMVIHSDDDAYYQMVIIMEKYIDYCIVVSEKIENKLIALGFDRRKIRLITWNINVDSVYRTVKVDNILKIGYAGRVTTLAKRLDYLPLIINELNEEGINYEFQIAGIGDYYDKLSEYVEKNNLKEKVILRGMLNKSEMRDFWRRQDIYFSCSDWEGHSISQCEGIACGAVPVVTNVSGASDDIQNGVTGYIVQIGDWKSIVDRICYLSKHFDVLKQMSDAGMKRMKERNNLYKDDILEELCR